MTPKKYFLWFLGVPLVVWFGIAGGAYLASIKEYADLPPSVQAIFLLTAVPAAVNLFIGPTIYAFWRHKKARYTILVITCILLFFGGIPRLLLWIWALKGKVEAPKATPPLTPPVAS